jgi:hypothetical protein
MIDLTFSHDSCRHLLIAFGAPSGGLEEAIEADEDLKVGADDAAEIFDVYVNPLQATGTRNLRLEVNKKNNTTGGLGKEETVN